MKNEQTYANHVRWFPLYHFIITPLTLILLVWQIVRLYQSPTLDSVFTLVFVLTVILIGLAARVQALKAQDRVIRLEEHLRFVRVLDAETAATAFGLPLSRIIALRFASDEELPELVRRVIAGELDSSKSIKLAVRSWRADHLRV